MLELLTERERFVEHDMREAMGLDHEQLHILYVSLFEQGLAILCLNISGGPSWYEITPRGREALRVGGDVEHS
jgi:hypothetical protein